MGAVALVSGFNATGFGHPNAPIIDFNVVGREMLTYYAPALVVLALTLAGAIIGALALARREDISQKNERAG